MTAKPDGSRPVVAMWRTSWLPHSETFIANQTAALRRWRPLTVGVRRLPDGLPIVPDHAPFGNTFRSRVAHKISSSIGYRGAFDGWLKAQGVQLIHAHFGPGGIKVLPIARRTRIPLAVTFHGFDATTAAAEKGPVGDRYRAQLAELFAGADRLIAVSEFIRGRLLELGAPESKTVVHYIGIPVDGAAVEASADGADGRAIVFVGRLVPVKGVPHLLRAFAALPETLRAATTLHVVGWGPEEPALRGCANDLRIPVHFTGRLSSEDVGRVLASSTLFCGPSITVGGQAEAFGQVFLEAASHGLPAVGYRSGGVAEAVQDGVTGLLAPEGDVPQLSAHLRRLLTEPDLARRMGAAGSRRVRNHFDIRRQTEQLELIYDDIVEGDRPARRLPGRFLS